MIDSVAQTFVYGEIIDIQCREAADIRWVSLFGRRRRRIASTRISVSWMPFSLGAGNRLEATIPNEPNLRPPAGTCSS